MVIILDKHVVWCYNFIEVHIHVFIVVWNLIWSLWSQHKIVSIPQNFGSVRVETFNFGLMLNCFGPVRSGENIIGSVRGRGHKIYYFSVRSGSGQKITGQCRFGVPKTLPRRTLIWITQQFLVTNTITYILLYWCDLFEFQYQKDIR